MAKRILIVDDEADYSFLLKRGLEAIGHFEVTVCRDPMEAVSYVERLKPDLLLLDVLMPSKGGEDVATEVQAKPELANIPIIFLTSLVRPDETVTLPQVIGGRYFMPKQVKVAKLIEVMNRVMSE